MASPEEFLESPEQILELAVDLPTDTTVEGIKGAREVWTQKDQTASIPSSVVFAMMTLEVPSITRLWVIIASDTGISQDEFRRYFLFAPSLIIGAETNLRGDDMDMVDLTRDNLKFQQINPIIQAEYYYFTDMAVTLLRKDPTGFDLVDHIAYGEEQAKKFRNLPGGKGELVPKIVVAGAERYKMIYCAFTRQPYIPRAEAVDILGFEPRLIR